MPVDFDKLIDAHLRRESRPKGVGKYYPSEAGLCLRKSFYSYKFPSRVEPDLLKVFEMGNIVHDFIVQVLKGERSPDVKLLKSEFPFKVGVGDFVISGRVDNLIMVQSSGEVFLVEVKSTKDLKFVKEAAPHNINQLQLYMHFTGVHNGLLLYVDKGNLKTRVFDVPYSESEANRVIDRFKSLHQSLKDDKLPEAEARAHKEAQWMCKYCEYKEQCEKDTPKAKHEK